MWREFFGPKARIIGIDLNPNAKKWEEHGFEIYIGSQSDESFWNDFKKKIGLIDVVLDDGGHTYEQQIITTEMLINNINDGGILVVEDTHTSYMQNFGPMKYSFIEYTKNMIDLINQRFSKLDHSNSEKRIWSVYIFESIVAFSVNKKATALLSEPTKNNGEDDAAEDFRHADSVAISTIDTASRKLNMLKLVPGAKVIARRLRTLLINRNFKARRYFR